MRRIIGLVLMGVGGFLLTTALLALVYVPGQVKKTPLNTDSYTRLTGTAAALPNGQSAPVKYLSRNVTDGEKSDGTVAVFDTFTCLVTNADGNSPDCVDDTDPQKRLVQAGTDRFATDRQTGVSVNDKKYIGDAQPHEGLVNKFPFDVEKKTYPFWDGVLDRSIDATFDGEEKVNGWDTYRFVVQANDEPAEISRGIQGTYSTTKTLNVDPRTGAILKQNEKQQRVLESGTTALDIDVTFTEATVKDNVEAARANNSKLNAVERAPLIAGILGLLTLLAGVFLSRDSSARTAGSDREAYGGSADIFGSGTPDRDTSDSTSDRAASADSGPRRRADVRRT